MPAHYFKCLECDQLFVHGTEEMPPGLVCAMGKCDIRNLTDEEAAEAVEEAVDEKRRDAEERYRRN